MATDREPTMTNPGDGHAVSPTILVPGWMDNERTLKVLANALNKAGQHAFICSPQPSDLSLPIPVMAAQLAEFIDATFGAEAPINLFGFSMGGLIGRVYLQKMAGWRRVQRFVTCATPHNGTILARFTHRPGAKQMQRNSPFLKDLNGDLTALQQIHFTSIWSPLDLMIVPNSSSLMPVGRMQRVMSPAHVLMPYDPQVHHAVIDALEK
jgi:triacylglycerol lipase